MTGARMDSGHAMTGAHDLFGGSGAHAKSEQYRSQAKDLRPEGLRSDDTARMVASSASSGDKCCRSTTAARPDA